MTDKQIAGYCDDIKETALRQFHKVQNQRKEISLLHKKCARQQAEIERLKPLEENFDKLLYMLNAVDMGQSVLEEQKHTIKAEAEQKLKEMRGGNGNTT